jgi:enolase
MTRALWHGKGVTRAVSNVNRVICPALKGLDAADQSMVDGAMLALENGEAKRSSAGTPWLPSPPRRSRRAPGAGHPLYRHIGGERP